MRKHTQRVHKTFNLTTLEGEGNIFASDASGVNASANYGGEKKSRHEKSMSNAPTNLSLKGLLLNHFSGPLRRKALYNTCHGPEMADLQAHKV